VTDFGKRTCARLRKQITKIKQNKQLIRFAFAQTVVGQEEYKIEMSGDSYKHWRNMYIDRNLITISIILIYKFEKL
jgi:hypothetical protein